MSNSLSEQLLKAGLISQEQISQAEQEKQQQKEKARAKATQARSSNARPGKSTMSKGERRPQKMPQNANKTVKQAAPATDKSRPSRPPSDLAQFYRKRDQVERQEREAEEKRRREQAERKRQTRQAIRELIANHQQNIADASIRYNFVVGETVKYVFVTAAQQTELAAGNLAITFMDGKRCLIPLETATQIKALDPDKLVVINDPSQATEPDELEQLLAVAHQAESASDLDEPPAESKADKDMA
ncbi:MAG: hypothetical protein CR991_02355 [Proteobacteria bacterium]|nr:MAG: hypothetical protein CR991_02355 [Pseudomonadota bacterium]